MCASFRHWAPGLWAPGIWALGIWALGIAAALVAHGAAAAQCKTIPVFQRWGSCEAMSLRQNALTIARDGAIWTTLRRGLQRDKQQLVLAAVRPDDLSSDPKLAIPVAGASPGSVVADPRRPLLHATWTLTPNSRASKTLYRAYDYAARRWTGAPVEVIPGATNHASLGMAVSPSGRLVVCLTSRDTIAKGFRGPWSCAIAVAEPDGAWSAPHPVSDEQYTGSVEVVVVGEVAHVFFRSTKPSQQISHRSFDLATRRWRARKPDRVSEPGRALKPAAGVTATADRDGNLYCIWGRGAEAAGKGEIRIGFARAEHTTAWSVSTLTSDPPIRTRVDAVHFGIARGPGSDVLALYSRQSEEWAHLYARILTGGQLLGKERRVSGVGRPRAHRLVQPLRDPATTSSVFALTSGYPSKGEVSLVCAGKHIQSWFSPR